ncbi:MAG: hypothetical protein CR975_00280 [Gammaproteobacteria bacterium]|nr:MAG: hypothetical protein CR975_00280 [Gammaproteobacteria bacterium]
MRDYAVYFTDRKLPEKRGVSIRRDVDWWLGYLAKRIAKLLFLLLLAVIFLTLKSLWQVGKNHQAFPVQRISLNSEVLITQPKDIQAVLTKFGDKSFFSLNIQQLVTEIESLPWIEKASVTRQWPNTLSIDLQERQAAYRWGQNELLDADGHRFTNVDKVFFSQLPLLNGVAGHEAEVIFAYQKLMAALGSRAEDLAIESFVLNKYLSWELHLQSGMVVKFGRDNFQQRLNRFVEAYQMGKLPDFLQLETIDLRYRQGFSVKWKPEFAPQTIKKPMLKVNQQI